MELVYPQSSIDFYEGKPHCPSIIRWVFPVFLVGPKEVRYICLLWKMQGFLGLTRCHVALKQTVRSDLVPKANQCFCSMHFLVIFEPFPKDLGTIIQLKQTMSKVGCFGYRPTHTHAISWLSCSLLPGVYLPLRQSLSYAPRAGWGWRLVLAAAIFKKLYEMYLYPTDPITLSDDDWGVIICIVTSSARYLGSIHFSLPAPSSRGAN